MYLYSFLPNIYEQLQLALLNSIFAHTMKYFQMFVYIAIDSDCEFNL